MGKRRIRNLRYLNAGEIVGFDPREDRRREAGARYGIRTFSEFNEAIAVDPDALVISTPPDLHMRYAAIAAARRKHFFVEASVVDEGMDEVIAMCEAERIVGAPSCTMRFHPSVRVIKDLVSEGAIGQILAFTYHCGQYLPDWHPWEDYRAFYVAKRETGACREIVPFELLWLCWVCGEPETVSCLRGKLSSLDVEIDDVYQVLLRLKGGGLGHMLVDVVSRVPYRTCRFLGEHGIIEWVWAEKRIRVFTASEARWNEYREPESIVEEGYMAAENMYIEEMRAFVRAIQGIDAYPYSLTEDRRILRLLYAAERSSSEGIHVAAKSWELDVIR